jgi:DNA-binding NarL/FixJ family response regulator
VKGLTSFLPAPYRVGSIDDHQLVSIAISSMLAPLEGIRFTGSADSIDGLLATGPLPDLVILDLRLGDGSSPLANVHRLHDLGASVLIFTSGESPFLLRLVAQANVLGIIRKSAPEAEFVDGVRRAARGKPVMSTDWATAVDSDPDLDMARLTPQEKRVLEKYASGTAAKSVAYELGISPNTVEEFLKRIRVKYAQVGRHSMTKVDLYQRAIEDGYLPLPGQ